MTAPERPDEEPVDADFARAWATFMVEIVKRLTPAERWVAGAQKAAERWLRALGRPPE